MKTVRLIGLVSHRYLLKFVRFHQFRHKLSFLLSTFFFFCVLTGESGARLAQHENTLPEGFLDKRFNNRLID